MIRAAIFGSGGRMGQAIIAALADDPTFAAPTTLRSGSDLAALAGGGVAIDFTVPEASVIHAQEAARRGLPLVIGTTGFTADQNAAIAECAATIPIVQSANMSIGVNLLAALVEQAAAKLGDDFDIEIQEMHHRLKMDAPSGTALLLGAAAANGRGHALVDLRAPADRYGLRKSGDIGFAVLRGGDIAGDHTVYFAGEGERLELTHRASSRTVFAKGALRAATWVMEQKPGLYSMRDVLQLP